MKRTRSAPSNSIVFGSDNIRSPGPDHVRGNLINHNEFCLSVGCYPEIDGETEFSIGRFDGGIAGLNIVFDGVIKTPNRRLVISTVDDEVLLEDTVSRVETRVRVSVSDLRWPDRVDIGWD